MKGVNKYIFHILQRATILIDLRVKEPFIVLFLQCFLVAKEAPCQSPIFLVFVSLKIITMYTNL